MTTDMTKGRPLKLIIQFTVPMLLGNLFQQLYNMVDTIVVGKGIGDNALAAVGSTGASNFLVLGFIIGLTSGFSILMAQAYGAGDIDRLKRTLGMSYLLAAVFAVLVTAVSMLGTGALLRLLQTPEEMFSDAYIYIIIIFAGIPFTVGYNLFASVLRSVGDSKTPLYAMIISSLANVALDVILVMGAKIGVAGAAIATVVSQLAALVYCLHKMRNVEELKLRKSDFKLNFYMIRRLFMLGIPVAIMNSITAVGCMILQYFVNGLGTIYAAGYSAANRVLNLVTQIGSTLGLAMATYCGQNLGAGRLDRIKEGVHKAEIMTVVVNIVLGILLILLGKPIVRIMVNGERTIELAAQYMIPPACTLWILGLLFLYRYAAQGMGDTFIPMFSGILELILRTVAAVVLVKTLEFTGIAIADISAWVGAGIMLAINYYRLIQKLYKKEQQKALSAGEQH